MKFLLFATAALFLPATLCHAAPPTLGGITATPSGNSAAVTGTVTSNGAATTVRARYGETTDYGSSAQSPGTFSASASGAPFTITLPGLKYGTTYHFKVLAENGDLPSADSGDLTFSIPAEKPGVGTPTVNVLDATQATISALITAKGGDTTVRVDYGTTAALGSTQAATVTVLANESKTVPITLTGLTKTTYFYKVVATNSVNSTESAALTFTVPQAPQVTATVTTKATSAAVKAIVTAHGDTVKLTLNYGLTNTYGSSLVINGIPGNSANLEQIFNVTGLSRNTTYNYSVRAEHSGGSAATTNATFKTKANSKPIARADSAQPNGRTPVSIPVLANDSDSDGDTLSIETVSKPTKGTVTVSGSNVIYTAGADFKGRDEFTYTVSDGQVPPAVAIGKVSILSPQAAIDGVNSAIIKDADGNDAGAYKIIGTVSGQFTARVSIGGTNSVVSGQFDTDGKFSTTLPNGTRVKFETTQNGTANSIKAEFERADGKYTAENLVNAVTATRRTELAGLYTMSLPSPGVTTVAGQTSTGLPEGPGFIRMTVKDWGGVRVQGVLGDGSKFSYASTLSGTDAATQIPLWLSPSDARVSGTIALTGTTDVTAAGDLKWYRPPDEGSKVFDTGFYTVVKASGGEYTPPEKNQRVLNASDSKATITIKGGNLSSNIVSNMTIDRSNHPNVDLGYVSKLTLYPDKGLFSGTFEHPFDGEKRSFQGVLLPLQGRATGVFTGVSQTGTVEITPGATVIVTPTPGTGGTGTGGTGTGGTGTGGTGTGGRGNTGTGLGGTGLNLGNLNGLNGTGLQGLNLGQ